MTDQPLQDVAERVIAIGWMNASRCQPGTRAGAICEDDGGALLLLPGGRKIRVEQPFAEVLGWLEARLR
jgi:hypothetical protein